jgi:hypothetical protein
MMTYLRKKFPFLQDSPRMATFFGVSSTVFIVAFLFSFISYLSGGVEFAKADAKEEKTSAALTSTVESNKTPILEVHIANNGMVYLQGARIEAINDKVIIVSTSWNDTKLNWTIYTNESYFESHHFGTDFLDSKGAHITINEMRVGDIVSVNGTLNPGSGDIGIKASVVRK